MVAAGPACAFDRSGFPGEPDGAVYDADPSKPDAAVFDARPPPPALQAGDLRLIYGPAGKTSLDNPRRASNGDWTTEPETDPLGGRAPWMIHRITPTTDIDELLMTAFGSGAGPVIRMQRLVQGAWVIDWSATPGPGVSTQLRGFDVEFEDSGEAIAVYGDGTNTPAYRIFASGSWSVERKLPLNDGGGGGGPNPDPNNGIVTWVELERRPGTDEIALAYADDMDNLVVLVWDGNLWDTATAARLEDKLKLNPVSRIVHNRAFDIAWETNSGDLVAAWGRDGAAGFLTATHTAGGAWSGVTTIVALSGTPHFVDLATDPETDQVAGGFYDMGDGTERLAVGIWNGFSWIDSFEIDMQISDVNDEALGHSPGAVGWFGETDSAVVVYADDATGVFGYATWDPVFGWLLRPPATVAGLEQPQSFDMVAGPDGAALHAAVSDGAGQLFAVMFDGADWAVEATLAMDLAGSESTPFSMDVRRSPIGP